MTDDIERTVNIPRWDYLIVGIQSPETMSGVAEMLARFGAEGWELVTVDFDNRWAYMKRVAGLIEVRA